MYICYTKDMKLIVGLGNPGDDYNFTRHNFGFLALEKKKKIEGVQWEKPKRHAIWLKFADKVFLKPQTYYNESGLAVQEALRFYKLSPKDILVVCDDFDLEFKQIRYRAHGSSGGNNGLKSIIQYLGTDEFARLRLGTNNPELRNKMGDVKFVLSRFSATEKSDLPDILKSVADRIRDF